MTDARSYWNKRHSEYSDYGSGTFTHSEPANRWFYRTKRKRIYEILRASHISLSQASVLDVACGSGIFVQFFLESGAQKVTGIDISDKAVDVCRERFADTKGCRFERVDISSDISLLEKGTFDLACMFEAIFLLTEETAFIAALRNQCSLLKPGGHLLISDHFPPATQIRHDRLTYYSRSLYEQVMGDNGVKIVAVFPQTRIFNRAVFPSRYQSLVERRFPALLYSLDRIALRFPRREIKAEDMFYCLAKKTTPA